MANHNSAGAAPNAPRTIRFEDLATDTATAAPDPAPPRTNVPKATRATPNREKTLIGIPIQKPKGVVATAASLPPPAQTGAQAARGNRTPLFAPKSATAARSKSEAAPAKKQPLVWSTAPKAKYEPAAAVRHEPAVAEPASAAPQTATDAPPAPVQTLAAESLPSSNVTEAQPTPAPSKREPSLVILSRKVEHGLRPAAVAGRFQPPAPPSSRTSSVPPPAPKKRPSADVTDYYPPIGSPYAAVTAPATDAAWADDLEQITNRKGRARTLVVALGLAVVCSLALVLMRA